MEPPSDPGHSIRPVERVAADFSAPIALDIVERFLPEAEIGGRVGDRRHLVPDQHPVVPGVGHQQRISHDDEPRGEMKTVLRSPALRRRPLGSE
jgi:hypothetical protein